MQGSNLENVISSNDVQQKNDPTIIKTDVGNKDGQNKCPKCGATDISLNVKSGHLRCNYCRFEFAPLKVEGLETDISKLSGEVISKVKGAYTLTYEVTDDGNNKATVERKVIVSDKTDPNSGILKKGAIYLTFDDGPSSVTTSTILDILKEENVKATFFVTNNGPDSLIKRIYDEGHTIAIHTASHTYSKVYASVDAYFDDLKIVSDRIKRITGQTTKIVRFPGGSSNTISRRYCSGIMTKLSEELFSRGYRYYDWNVDSNDASTSKNKQAVYNNVTKNLSKNRGNVVLMHDIKTQTRDALRDIIKYGKENGYTFEKIDMDTYMVRQHINN